MVPSYTKKSEWTFYWLFMQEWHCFLPEQFRTKIDREPTCQTCKFLMFWKQIRDEVHCLHMSPELLTSDVGFRWIEMSLMHRWKCKEMKMWANVMRVCHASTSATVWHAASLAHNSPCNTRWFYWSTRFSLTNLIGWLFSDVTGLQGWLGFSSCESRTNIFVRVRCIGPDSQFLSDFDRVKSKMSLRLSSLSFS